MTDETPKAPSETAPSSSQPSPNTVESAPSQSSPASSIPAAPASATLSQSSPVAPRVPAKKPGLELGPGVGVNVTQDMAAPERKLPPVKILLYTIGGLAVVLGIWGFLGRAKPQGAGSIDNVAAVEIPGQNAMLVALTVTLHNSGERPL